MAKKSKKKRKKSTKQVVHMSPVKYIKLKSRGLPIHACHITENWEDMGLARVIVVRQQPSGNFIIGSYLVDVFCLGLKKAFYQYNATAWDYAELLERANMAQDMMECDYVLAHNVIYGGIAYAEELGFSPHKDFDSVAKYILEEDDEQVELLDLDFGRDGQPVLFVNPGVNPTPYIKTLDRSVGKGNYEIIFQTNEWDDDDGWDDESDSPALDSERPFQHLIEQRTKEAQARLMQSTDPAALQLSSLEISYEPMDSEYEELYAHDRAALKEALSTTYNEIYDTPEAAIPKMRRLIEKYPGHPTLRNHLIMALKGADQDEEANRETRRLYEKFPEYLYARISYAEMLLMEGKNEDALAVFGNEYALQRIYPDRQTFHFTEVLSYYGYLVNYFIFEGKVDQALMYYQMMKGIDPDHPQTEAAESLVGGQLMVEEIGRLTGLLKDETS